MGKGADSSSPSNSSECGVAITCHGVERPPQVLLDVRNVVPSYKIRY